MIAGTKYVDVMDRSRSVIPTGQGDQCRVMFDNVFVGKADIPAKLFSGDNAKWYGFVPASESNEQFDGDDGCDD